MFHAEAGSIGTCLCHFVPIFAIIFLMEKYTVLLVDDEPEVIEIMQKKIDWEGLGFTVYGTAENGVQALEMIYDNPPDVVMTDIKMPYMDGMELSAHIREKYPDIRIVVFTGFDEFEYAKQAIHLNITEYILKPVNATELAETLDKIRSDLDKEREGQKNIDSLIRYYQETLPAMQSRFLTMLLENQIPDDEIDREKEEHRVEISEPYVVAVIFHVSTTHMPEGADYQVLRMAVWKYVNERLREKWKALFLSYQHDTVMVAQLSEERDLTRLTDECGMVCSNSGHMTGALVSAGVGTAVEDIRNLRTSWLGAREALSYRVLYGTGKAINIREIAPAGNDYYDIGDGEDVHAILQQIRMGTEELLNEAIDHYSENLTARAASVDQYHVELSGLIANLIDFTKNNEIPESWGEYSDPYRNITEMDQTSFIAWLKKTCLNMQKRLAVIRESSGASYVDKTKTYVKEHYSESGLSIGDVCRTLGVSESYFSSVFKKETGESFVSYLTEYRMETAARLLLETSDKSYVIGKKVGFEDANYFSYVFKKQYGVSPTRYRKREEDQ